MSCFILELSLRLCMCAKSLHTHTHTHTEVAQSCPTLWDPMDCSPPGSSVHGIFQAWILEWAAISFSNAWKWKVKVKSQSEVAQSCPTLSNPMDCSPPGSSVHGILQARVLEWGAIAFSHFKHQVLFYTFSKALGQRFDIFSSPSPRLLSQLPFKQGSCFSDSLTMVFTCDYIVTHGYIWAEYHIPQFISYLSKSLPLVS